MIHFVLMCYLGVFVNHLLLEQYTQTYTVIKKSNLPGNKYDYNCKNIPPTQNIKLQYCKGISPLEFKVLYVQNG